jgi:guanine nucleotide-binding protein G(i) subunit alpha
LIDEVARIAAADYVPTEADVTRIQARDFFTITSHVDLRDDRCLSIRVTNVGCQKRNPKSLIRPLLASSPPTDVVILCVNLARYDQAAEANEVLQSLEYLSLISHLRTTRNRKLPIILLLTHERDFREKLSTIPLARCFPKYRGGHDFQRATEHVIKRFRTVVHGQYFFPRVAGVNIEEDIEFLLASIKAARPCITSRKLAEAGFL